MYVLCVYLLPVLTLLNCSHSGFMGARVNTLHPALVTAANCVCNVLCEGVLRMQVHHCLQQQSAAASYGARM